MLTVILDVQLTKRKRAHLVVNPDGETQFSASRFGDVLDWLYETEVSAFNVETVAGESFRLSLSTTRSAMLGFAKDAVQPEI